MPVFGSPKFSVLVVKEITLELRDGGPVLTCKAAFVNPENNVTHGWTKGEGSIWSRETLERLQALLASMEEDLGVLHFNGGAPKRTAERPSADMGGLGEYIEEANQA